MQITKKNLAALFSLAGCLVLFLGVVQSTPALAQSFNQQINYQGKLTASSSVAVADGTYSMVFRLYTVQSGGTNIWSETQDVEVQNGLFSVMLGTSTSLASVDFSQTLYLGVNIEADGEMTPRKILGAVPAAFEANNATTFDNLATTSFLRSDQDDTASGLLTFTGGFISSASSTIDRLTTGTTTVTTLDIGGELITSLTGTGLTNTSGVLTVATSTLGLGDGSFLGLSDTPGSFTANRLLFTNGTGDTVTDSANFTFDGSTLTAPTFNAASSTLLSQNGTRLFWSTSTSDSIAIGEGAGNAFNATGEHNVALGYQAGFDSGSTTNSDFLTAVGYRSGYQNTGKWLTAQGSYSAMQNTGNRVTAQGYESAFGNTGFNLTALGYYSGNQNTGSDVTAVGYLSAYQNTGDNLTAIGSQVSRYRNAPNSTIMGYQAGFGSNFTRATTSNNLILGYQSGYSIDTGADNNILLGYQAADSLTTGANNIIIGYDVEAPSNTGSNQLNIGNLLFGTGIDGTGTTLSSGNIGIGTTSPSSKLTVAGDAYITGALRDGTNNAGTTGYVLQTTGTSTRWVATSTLGIGGGASTFLGLSDTPGSFTANRLLFTNGAGDAVTDSAGLLFDGTNLDLAGANVGLAFQGTRMLYGSTTNDSYTFGEGAGESFTDQTIQNVAIGYQAGQFASTTGSDINNFVGYQAGQNNTGSSNNIFGAQAGQNNTGGSNNIFGVQAGQNNTGGGNVAIGGRAARDNTGGWNVLLGDEVALRNTGSFNNILGSLAGVDNTGSYNNLFGGEAGGNNIGDYNNFLGQNAGYANTGFYNNSFGYYAGFNNTGSYSEFIGFETAGRMSASSTVAIGGLALRGGSGSIFSGNNATTTNNIAIGYGAGYNVATGGDNNLLLGYRAADSLTTGANNIVIGYDVEAPSNTGSNQLNIGNLLFGTGIDGTGTTLSSGNIGIGTSSPSSKLDVWGDFRVGTSSVPTLFADTSDNWVGIGTTSKSIISTTTERLTIAGGGIIANDPTNPVEVGQFDDGGQASGITVVGRYAYVADAGDGLEIIDISDPINPVEVGQFDDGGFAQYATIVGRYAYVADATDGLEIIDISDPTNPVEVGQVDDGGSAQQITVVGRYAYVADDTDGIEIIDISDPTNPVEVGQVDDGNQASGIAVVGRYAYVADWTDGLEIIDISDPTNPVEVGQVVDGDIARSVTVVGRYAYVADNYDGLEIIDISDPTNPFEVAQFDDGDFASDVTIAGRYAYVADGNDGLEIIDIGGSEFSSLFAGSLGATQANIDQDLTVGQNALINSNLTVGNDTRVGGLLSIQGYSSSTDTLNQALLSLGGETTRNSFMSFLGGVNSTTQNVWSAGLNQADGSFRIASSSGLATNPYFTIGAGGNVGIGTTTPSEQLTIAQQADNRGFALRGFDDQADEGFDIAIGSNGIPYFDVIGPTGTGYLSVGTAVTAAWSADSFVLTDNVELAFGNAEDYSVGYLSSDDSFRIVDDVDIGLDANTRLLIDPTGNIGIGTTTPASKLTLENLTLDGGGVSGLDQNLVTTNSVASTVQYGNYLTLTASNTATTTIVGSIVRVADNTTFGNTVRGLEVQTNRGSNTQGENTALSGFARTFGVRGVTTGNAGGSFEPAGGFFETEGTTQGNAIRGFSDSITTASLLSLFQSSSTFAGTGLAMNFGNGGGDFSSSSSKYLDFQNAGTSVFSVSAFGTTTIGDGTTNNMAGLQIGFGGLCVDNDGTCTASTTGQIASVSTYTGNSDLAEMYFSSTALQVGEVVQLVGELSIDRANSASTLPVLGVVSTKPGVVMGSDDTSTRAGEEAFPIALAGRVPVQLSTENGPIAAGDELMLSSLSGVAMKATSTGQVIGIALEAFDDTRYYSKTYINQFGDDLVDPVYEPIATNDDPRINDGCYYSGGNATGEESCVPLSATTTNAQLDEANNRAADESVAKQLAELARERSERATLATGETVRVGQVVMFVERSTRWLDNSQYAALATLLSTSTESGLVLPEQPTILDRLVQLAQGFVDGVLTLTGLKAEKIETNELCIDGVCVTGDELRALLDSQTADATEDEATDAGTTTDTNTDTTNSPATEEISDEITGGETDTATSTLDEGSTTTESAASSSPSVATTTSSTGASTSEDSLTDAASTTDDSQVSDSTNSNAEQINDTTSTTSDTTNNPVVEDTVTDDASSEEDPEVNTTPPIEADNGTTETSETTETTTTEPVTGDS